MEVGAAGVGAVTRVRAVVTVVAGGQSPMLVLYCYTCVLNARQVLIER